MRAIRAIALLVAVLAGAAAVIYAVTAVTTSQILWVVESPIHRGGEFVSLPLPMRLAHTVAFVLGAATIVVIALLVADLAKRVRPGVAFVPAVSRTAWSLAIALAVGSWLTEIASNIAGSAGLVYPDDVSQPLSFTDLDSLEIDWSVGSWTFLPDLPLLGLAVVLGVLAYIIRSGERLQRDTEGLV